MNESELLVRKATLVTTARDLLARTEAEKREFRGAESASWNAVMADVEKIDQQLHNVRMQEAIERSVGSSPSRFDESAQAQAWRAYLRGAPAGSPKLRALQVDSDPAGGFYTAPQLWVADLIKAIDDAVWIRQWATKTSVPFAQSLGLPYLSAEPADADWTTELGTGDEDTAMTFGKRELFPHPLAKRIKVSNKLLRITPLTDALVLERLAYKFAVTGEKAYMTGSGSGQPLGVFVASDDGIPTSRDVSTGNTETSIQTDGLKEAKYTLKAGYLPRAKWIFHRDAVKQIAKLQDDEGHYLWQPSVQVGQPDMLEGVPVFVSEYAPSTFTTGQYVGLIGDFSYYRIADALDFIMQRLLELYALTSQTGFIGRMESDGMPALAEAFARVTLA